VSEVGNLLVFSVGPVQSFIASARKIEDLWSGSYILSYLAEQAMSVILEQAEAKQVKVEMIYPSMKTSTCLQHQRAGNRRAHIEVASRPNRFICWVEADGQSAGSAGGSSRHSSIYRINQLAKNLMDLRRQQREITRKIKACQNELDELFAANNMTQIETDIGTLTRRETNDGTEWKLEL
jgi:hypothetical protein